MTERWTRIGPWALWALFGALVTWRGAFPPPYALVGAGALLCGALAVRIAGRGQPAGVDWATAGWAALVGAYLVALPGAAAVNQAVIGALVIAGAAAAFWLGRRLWAGPRRTVALDGLALVTALTAAAGLAAFAWPHGLLAPWIDPSTGRLAGVLEYPNATGALAAAGMLAAWLRADPAPSGREWRWAAGAVNLVALAATASIGALGVAVLALAAAAILAPARRGWLAAGVAAAGLALALRYGLGPGTVTGWLAALITAAAVVPLGTAAQAAWAIVRPRSRRGRSAVAAILAVSAILGVAHRLAAPLALTPGVPYTAFVPAGLRTVRSATAGPVGVVAEALFPNGTARILASGRGAGVLRVPAPPRGATREAVVWNATGPATWRGATVTTASGIHAVRLWAARLLPATVYAHVVGLQLSAYDLASRAAMIADGLTLLAIRPWRGWGAGGWAAAYRRVQTFGYVASVPHDAVIQVGVEAGLLGWAALALLGIGVARAARRSWDGTSAALAGVLAVAGAHALGDWDLAIPAWLWTVSALAGALTAPAAPGPARGTWRLPWVLAGAGVLASAALAVGQFQSAAADALLARQQPLTALPVYLSALRWDPLSAADRYAVAEIDEELGVVSPAARAAAAAAYRAAVRLAPTTALYAARYGLFLARQGAVGPAVRWLAQAQRDDPYAPDLYPLAVGVDETVGFQAAARHDRRAAAVAWRGALALAAAMQRASARQPAGTPASLWLPPSTPAVRLAAGFAALGLHDPAAAARLVPRTAPTLPAALARVALAWERHAPSWPAQAAGYARRWPAFRAQWRLLRHWLSASSPIGRARA